MEGICKIGVDIGSTTLKIVVLDLNDDIIYRSYQRHKANINAVLKDELKKIGEIFHEKKFTITMTGSAGMGIAERTNIPFIQEVIASIDVVRKKFPHVHTLIDIGGEDAKMVLLRKGQQPDIRMNGSCAGGTGAFIDQMADLLNITLEELGEQALLSKNRYPVASRCGVFAKTDIQNLIGRHVSIPDISQSILHAVALQTITTLARGCDIEPAIMCIGGPLTFFPTLRESFMQHFNVTKEEIFLPENSNLFPAWGAALHHNNDLKYYSLNRIIDEIETNNSKNETTSLPILFENREQYIYWKKHRSIKTLKERKISPGETIPCFLGIDSGSTTTKIFIMDVEANLIFSYYAPNEGSSFKKVIEGIGSFKKEMHSKGVNWHFLSSAVTGYGEDLIRSALGIDYGIVETIAHLTGAQHVDPNTSFILDIGGQDMKSIFVRNGIISNIELNEACSSGCGSFLQNFASTMNMSLEDFTLSACNSKSPCDLGSRCTVFMNSKVKQSFRENASIGDIAAGLAYSVVKNCLFKVLKISNLKELGDNIVVQGGTFKNDAVYRALELLSRKSVSSTDRPELMGAFGAALYARNMWRESAIITSFDGKGELPDSEPIKQKDIECGGCTNHCLITHFTFSNGNSCYAGNKCEKIYYSKHNTVKKGYNVFDFKNDLLFNRKVLSKGQTMGIPRALNMYENYPFWHKLFTECGFKVILSPESTTQLYQKGVGGVMSDNICFPAKLVHGHIIALMEANVDRIFYPIVPKEEKELTHTGNSFNCPVVSGYPDVIRSSMNPEEVKGIPFDSPVINFHNINVLKKGCRDYLISLGVPIATFNNAFEKAIDEKERFIKLLQTKQQAILDRSIEEKKQIFVVAGRPYHADALIQQKVGQILSDLGVTVLSDDLFRNSPSFGFSDLNMVAQWSYPNRVVQAAMEVAKLPSNVQLVQLNSFGCGPDSFFMDETGEILKKAGKNHTIIRIDEIASPGSIRLRLRSLVESLKNNKHKDLSHQSYKGYRVNYTKEDRKKTILIPWFADFLSPFFPAIAKLAGYKLENLPRTNRESAELGLNYGHNEVCYPSTLVLGDIIHALQSGKYDINDVVVGITQTGGQCRATNYIAQIKLGLESAGFTNIPVIALTTGKVYQSDQRAFNPSLAKITNITVYMILYGDALQQMCNTTIVRERVAGETQQLFDLYIERGIEAISKNNAPLLLRYLNEAVSDFNKIAIYDQQLLQVGVIGEIYLKYNSYGQAHISQWLREHNVEVVTPPILDFIMQFFVNSEVNEIMGVKKGSFLSSLLRPVALRYMNKRIKDVDAIFCNYRFYTPPESIFTKAEHASEVLSLSNQFGEGWAIAAEVASYAWQGIKRVVCVQPFGCIANHIVAKGIEKRLKKLYPTVNMLFLDIDGGVSEVNLQNRLYFMIT